MFGKPEDTRILDPVRIDKRGWVRDFAPRGRSHAVIYAVTLKCQPGIVKLGMTTRWHKRRQAYDTWNLADGDGIDSYLTYLLTEECVNLLVVEATCLAAMTQPPYRGREWFKASLDDAKSAIEGVLHEYDISYILDHPEAA